MAGTILFGIDVESASDSSKNFLKYGSELFLDLKCPVTWYVTGKTLEMYPEEFQQIDRGIERSGFIDLQAHTYDHILLKTVLMKVPEGKVVHGNTDWYYVEGSSLEVIDEDLGRCQEAFEKVLGRRANGLTAPWCYYRGLGDRPDLLEIVSRYGFKMLRSFGRDENDSGPVPLEWQPFFYKLQGYPDILELMINGFQDDFYWEMLGNPDMGGSYVDYLKTVADRVARDDLVWGLCSHDHGCETEEGFEKKGEWFREIINYARQLGTRFLTASQFYDEMISNRE